MHKILCLTSGLESIVYRITVASFGADWCNGGLSSISMVLILETVSMKGKCVPGIVVEVYFCYANTRFCPEIQFPECLVGYKHGHHGLWSCLQSTDYTHLDQITTKTGYCIHTRTHAHTHANTHTHRKYTYNVYIQCILAWLTKLLLYIFHNFWILPVVRGLLFTWISALFLISTLHHVLDCLSVFYKYHLQLRVVIIIIIIIN